MKTYAEEKRIRPDVLTASVYMAVVTTMAYAIICHRFYGDKGAFFSAAPLSIYLFCYCGLVLAVQKAVYIMVRLRARRSQYQNAQINMQRSMNVFIVLSLLFGGLTIALSYVISRRLFGADRGYFQLIIAGAAILLLGSQGVLRGYLQGVGYTRPIVISDLLIAITSLVSGTIAVVLLSRYGQKVNALFHVDEFSAVYGSAGFMLGIAFGSLVGLVQIIISYNLRRHEITEFVKSGAPRYLDNKNDVLTTIRPLVVLYCTPALMTFVDQCIYVLFTRKKQPDVDYFVQFGTYSGRTITSIILIAMLCCVPFIKSWNRVMARIERDELEGARARFKGLMRMFNCLVIPVSIFVLALSDTLVMTVFGKSTKLASSLMMLGGVGIFLCCFAILFSWLINHMGKSVVLMVDLGICWIVHIVSAILLCGVFNVGVMGLLIACILGLAVYDEMSFFMISKMLRYRQDHFRSVLIPALASVVAGLLAFILNKLLVNRIGDLLTLIICVLIFFVSYMMVMIVTRGFLTHELKRIPLGFIFEPVASKIQNDGYYEG